MNPEDELIAWLRDLQPGSGLGLPGDDAAVLGTGAAARALTVDQQIAGVHVPADLNEAVWARRLLAVNLSDLAAMGGQPRAALLTLAVPGHFALRKFLRAAVDACRKAGVTLAGGDLATASQAVTTMTLIGCLPPGGRWISRSAARPGDRLWVGGSLGGSGLGRRLVAQGARLSPRRTTLAPHGGVPAALARLARQAVRAHLAPRPRLELGWWLGSRRRAAAIDVSDGLATDLGRLCRESGVGAVVDVGALPIHPAARKLATLTGATALDLALGGGEDYALLFALPAGSKPPARHAATAIGRIVDSPEVRIEEGGRRLRAPDGWDHLRQGRARGRS